MISYRAFGLMLYYPARGLQYSHSTETLTYAVAFNICDQKPR